MVASETRNCKKAPLNLDEIFVTCQPSCSTNLQEIYAHRNWFHLNLPRRVQLFENCEFGDYPPIPSA